MITTAVGRLGLVISLGISLLTIDASTAGPADKTSICKTKGEIVLLQTSAKGEQPIVYCDIDGPRAFTRAELFSLYNNSKSLPEFNDLWSAILGTKPNDFLGTLKSLPDDELSVELKDKKHIKIVTDLFRKMKGLEAADPRSLNPKENSLASAEILRTTTGRCFVARGTLVMSESKDPNAGGCTCGNKPMKNTVEFKCNKGNIEALPNASASGSAGQGPDQSTGLHR